MLVAWRDVKGSLQTVILLCQRNSGRLEEAKKEVQYSETLVFLNTSNYRGEIVITSQIK